MKGQFTIKYLICREIWKIPCVVQIFPVLYLNSLCFPCLEKVITKFSIFPVPWPPWMCFCVKNEGSMINHLVRKGNHLDKDKWLPDKNSRSYRCIMLRAYYKIGSFHDQTCGQGYPQTTPMPLTTSTTTLPDDNTRLTIHDCRFFGIYAKWANTTDLALRQILRLNKPSSYEVIRVTCFTCTLMSGSFHRLKHVENE